MRKIFALLLVVVPCFAGDVEELQSLMDAFVEHITNVKPGKWNGIQLNKKNVVKEKIVSLSKKIASGTYAINATKRILNAIHLKLLYCSLVHSHLSYGTLIWGSAYKYSLRKLEI